MSSSRSLDRRVYLRSHPMLFALLAAVRRRPVQRLGRTLIVHDREAYLAALTRIPLDRTAEGTTGGAVDRLAGAGGLFDQQGDEHRRTRRDVAERLGAAGVDRLRPLWVQLMADRLAPLADGRSVDLVPLAAEIAGTTAAALLALKVDPFALATAAQEAGATAARAHLPGISRRQTERESQQAAERLLRLVSGGTANGGTAGSGTAGRRPTSNGAAGSGTAGGGTVDGGLAATLAVAAVNTTVAALPRAAAWVCGEPDLWAYAREAALADELLRVTSPTPLLPRVAAAGGDLGGRRVHAGDRMLLIARHAADAHRRDPDPIDPAPARTAQLVFGAGPHACPGARLARQQLSDFLAALAPHRPVVVRARADRRSALPSWRSLIVRAT
ncbi:cytochrome P450 [Actinoplanes sp. NPDC026619]|uniref:cytochrome P450 n=1 Tax=Actinoplanes sp. NPDC026619 TaxID=3155798 RepID=UPI003406867A